MSEEFDFDTFGDADDVQEVRETGELTLEPIITETTEPVQTLELEPEPEMELVLESAPPAEEIFTTTEEVKATIVEPTTNALALNTTMDLTTMNHPLTFEQKKIKVQQDKELLEFMAKTALNKDDFWTPPASRGKKALTRSGCNKLATVFNISTRTLKIWIVKEVNIKGEEDIIAYATVRAEKLNGVFVEITANKPLSDYESDKPGAKPPREWVDMQTLKGTAETRARNRAIQNIIGFVPKDYIVATKEEFRGE